jgi:uncharacterized protein DUF5666
VTKTILLLISATAIASTLGCGRRDVQVISSTTTPSAVPANSTPSVNPNQLAQLQGLVTGVSGACPALTFTVSRTTVSTTSSTNVDGGCDKIVNGATVALTGTRQSNGSVVASHVEIRQVEVAGSIAALQGSCPVIRFSIGSTAVSTTANTTFSGGACSHLANGQSASVDGYLQSNGAIAATRVSMSEGGFR